MTLEAMEKVIEILMNNGVSLGCLVYFMYMNNTTLKDLKETIENLKDLIQELIIKEEK